MKLFVMGAGKIGVTISYLLASSGKYHVYLCDQVFNDYAESVLTKLDNVEMITCDISTTLENPKHLPVQDTSAVICCLPYFLTDKVARFASKNQLHYFDLTEDVESSDMVSRITKHSNTVFVPHCGLAPGFINIIASNLMKQFQEVDIVKLRVGALPENISNSLKYAITWSIDGLINEYGNDCEIISEGETKTVAGLTGLETITLDGVDYEAFYTSGGIGTMINTFANKVNKMDYKTMRYPGHCEKMKFLMRDLKLNNERDILKQILMNAIASTKKDVVLVYAAVNGQKDGEYVEKQIVHKYSPKTIKGEKFTAIQWTTATSACAAVDIVLQHPDRYKKGLVLQEDISLVEFYKNEFGKHLYQKK